MGDGSLKMSSHGLQSGHWEVEKNGKQHFCMVSGGYVVIGSRPVGPQDGFAVLDANNTELEKFESNTVVRKFIKENMGDKVLKEVSDKVVALIEVKNRRTAAPAKES